MGSSKWDGFRRAKNHCVHARVLCICSHVCFLTERVLLWPPECLQASGREEVEEMRSFVKNILFQKNVLRTF